MTFRKFVKVFAAMDHELRKVGTGMSVAKKLALIALGYVLSLVAGCGAVTVNELLMPSDISQGSPGMVAFGDMILFVLVTGFIGLIPTLFLLRLAIDKAPRASLNALILVALAGPVSWLLVRQLAGGPPAGPPQLIAQLLGPLIAFVAIPRIVAGPVVVVAEGLAMLLVRQRSMRIVLVVAVLMDLVPIGIYTLHMARGIVR
jgi:hypothetical protein